MTVGALNIAPGLSLPLEAVTETFAILGTKGSGKTTAARVLVEELATHGQQCVVIDPTGVWWGIKSSRDGKKAGLPFTVLGGTGDIPISPSSGSQVADLVIDDRLCVVLDLSEMRRAEQRQFVLGFVSQLYHRSREALMLVIDEADLFSPQRSQKNTDELLGAMEDLVRRGRVRGIGCTLITQRPASISKEVLSQASSILAMQLSGTNDRKAFKATADGIGEPERVSEMMDTLAGMQVGEGWFWSPAWLQRFERVKVRRSDTFDSSATPKPGARRVVPKVLSPVNVADLRARFFEIVEESEAKDPVALQRKVVDLERRLAAVGRVQPAAAPVDVVVETVVHVAVVPSEVVEAVDAASLWCERSLGVLQAELDDLAELSDGLVLAREAIADAAGRVPPREQPGRRSKPVASDRSAPSSVSPRRAPVDAGNGPEVKAGARRILEAVARHHPMRMSQSQIGVLAGFKAKGSGTFSSYKSALRTNGYIHVGDDSLFEITDAGLDFLGIDPPAPMGTDELIAMWSQALKKGARVMLHALVDAYPAELSRQELADAAELSSPASGTFGSYLSMLRTNNLADVSGDMVKASDSLFLG